MEITFGVHLIPNVIANPYLVVEAGGLTLIDAGLPGSAGKILRYITEQGHAPSELKRIIITHADLDHIGGLAALKKASRARVYASAIEAEAMANGRASRQLRPRSFLRRLLVGLAGRLVRAPIVRADELVQDGQVLPVLGGLHVIDTRGHTPGHISLFSPSTGVLFSGDSVVTRGGKLVRSLPDNTWDERQADESARRQAALGAKVVCPGHGPAVLDAADKFPMV